jgi:hypothetical protein
MGLGEMVLGNAALNITLMSVDQTSAIRQPVLLKDDATLALGANLLSGHFYGYFQAEQEQTAGGYLATTPDALRPAVFHFTAFPLLIAFATAIMIF